MREITDAQETFDQPHVRLLLYDAKFYNLIYSV